MAHARPRVPRRDPRRRRRRTLRAINIVALEQYLYGVVPAEMPSRGRPPRSRRRRSPPARMRWRRASRRAVRRLLRHAQPDVSRRSGGEADDHRRRGRNARPGARSTAAGRHDVFFSTSGGETESSCGRLGHSDARTSSRSPTRTTTISPFHDWGPVPVTAETLAKALEVAAPIARRDATLNRPAGRSIST